MKSPGQSAYEAMISWWPEDYRPRILSWEELGPDGYSGRERWELVAQAAIDAYAEGCRERAAEKRTRRAEPVQGSGYSPAESLLGDEGES